MASTCIFTPIISLMLMIKSCAVQGAGNGLIVSTQFSGKGSLTSYQGDVDTLRTANQLPTTRLDVQSRYITSLTAEPSTGSLYFLDVQYKSIYKLNNTNILFNNPNMSYTRLHEGISVAIGSIVFDWISRNIYWTDRYHNWISMMPVTTADPLMFRPVIEDAVSVPVALAIDPKNGYLFWSDTQPSSRIEWSNLLGENREVMLYGNLLFVVAITVDPSAQKVYLADYSRQNIEEVEYRGLNRKKLIRLNTYRIIDIAFYKNYLCLTEQRYGRTMCYSTSGQSVWSDNMSFRPWGICVYDENTQPQVSTDYCSEKNCSHFCVNTPTEARCVCKEGYTLQNDTICTASHTISGKGLIFTNGTDICIIHITAVTGSKVKPECIVSNLGNGTAYLQADSINGKIHFWNSTGLMLKTYDLLAKTSTLITYTGKVTGLFYDWIADNLYWSESESNLIKMAALKETTAQAINVFSQVSKPRYLTGNPHKYLLYWISGEGDTVVISMGQFDGTGVNTVVPSNKLKDPSSLTYDEVRNRLYWVDQGQAVSIKADGTGTEQHLKLGSVHTLVMYKDYIVWTSGVNAIKANYLGASDQGTTVTIDLTVHGKINGICVYDSRLQRRERGPCEDDNGNCQHICIPSSNDAICRCRIGFTPDGNKCKSTTLVNNFALLVDYTHNVIFQIPTDKAAVTENDFVAIDIPGMESPIGVVYDSKAGYIYWSELYNQRIQKMKLGTTNVTTVIKFEKWYPDRMIMDQSTGYIYYTAIMESGSDGPISYIGVLRLDLDPDGPKNKILVKGLNEPRCLAIHPKKGVLFWGELGATKSYIGKADMDGENAVVFISDINKVDTPIGLAIDYTDTNEYLYWADLVDDQIKRIAMDKTDYKVFYSEGKTTHPSDVFLQGAYVYYISWNKWKISKINKATGLEENWMTEAPDLGRLDNLVLIPGDQQPVNDRCKNKNGGCSTFCLAKPNGVTVCACEEKVNLRKDKRTCENVCNSAIPNGMIDKDCTIYPGAVCGYTCNTHHRKNTQIDKITCLKNMSWSETNLCEGITCDLNSVVIQNGKIKSGCTGSVQEICEYTCDSGYERNKVSPTFQCMPNGQWNTDFKGFCERIKCDIKERIQHGRLDRLCQGVVGQICDFTCDNGYTRSNTSLRCLETSKWSSDFKDLCIKTKLCDSLVPNGGFEDKCTLMPGTANCRFFCKNGYSSLYPEKTVVRCLPNATWTIKPEKLCTKPQMLTKLPETSNAGLVGGLLGVIIAILIAVIIIGVVCYIHRRKLSQQAVYKSHPNVQFKSDAEQSTNPYTVFENPPEPAADGGIRFSNPLTGVEQPPSKLYTEYANQPEVVPEGAVGGGLQFSNPLSSMDDAYITISDKKEILPESETEEPQAFYLRDIGEKTLNFTEKDGGYDHIKSEKHENEINDHKENPYETIKRENEI